MDDPLSRGLPFELADIWRRSILQVKDEDHTLWAPLEASFPPLNLDIRSQDLEDELVIPPLDGVNGKSESHLEPPESDIASPSSELWDTGQSAPNEPASIWDLDLNLDLPPERPRLHTWEAFEKKAVPNVERTAYLSEAGPGAFDAVLAERKGKSNGALPQDVMLRALCNLALGRASVFFQWDEHKAMFFRILDDVPISGYSSAACDSYIQRLMDYATVFRSLRSYCIDALPKRNALPCKVSFSGCVSGILDAIEENITNQLSQVRSILQLQALVTPPYELLGVLNQISRCVSQASSDEGVISDLSDQVHQIVSEDSSLGGILRVVLERTSTPWLEKLAMDVGLTDDPTGVGVSQLNEDDEDAASVELNSSMMTVRPQLGEMPGFMSAEDRAMIHDTKASLRILRKTGQLHSHAGEARRLFETALGKDSMLEPAAEIHRLTVPDYTPALEGSLHEPGDEGLLWADVNARTDYLSSMDTQMSNFPRNPNYQDDRLRAAVQSYCNASKTATTLSDSLTLDLSPLDRLRPGLSLQSHYLNRTLLRHLFTKNLTHHLRLQHSYHFLASGEFTTRLCTALFSAETQSAERKRGTVPTGQTMGLRLGAARNEQRWPPASSELRLTLMDVLTETYRSDYPSQATKLNQGSKDPLPGGLSFSVRELPDHEIERVMDPASIYALDFLRLQYSAPAPLDAVFTSAAMGLYDSVFRLLVRVLRCLCVTSALIRKVSDRRQFEEQRTRIAFAQQAHAFVTTLMSHFMDVGIAAPWRTFMRRLEAVEQGLNAENKAVPVGIESLKHMHTTCLDTIRSRLFLRRKQEKLRLAVEEVLSAVLKGAAVLDRRDGDVEQRDVMKGFEDALKALLKLLRTAIDKPPKMRSTTGMHDGSDDHHDVEMMKMLLTRLDWNGVYSETVSSA